MEAEVIKTKCLKDKREFVALDVFKVVLAIAIAAMHLMALADLCPELTFWFNQVPARLGVPFFLVSSGYFLYDKLNDDKKVVLYIQRLIQLYILYTLLHLGLMWAEYEVAGKHGIEKILMLLRDIFWLGSYVQFWYFPAVIVAVVILYCLMKRTKLKEKNIIIVAIILYAIGVMENAYGSMLLDVPVMGTVIEICRKIFLTTRNGVFFGFPLVFMGVLFKKYAERIKKKPYFIIFIIGLVFMSVEAYFINTATGQAAFSMLGATPLATAGIFLGVCFVSVPERYRSMGTFMRKLSMLIFGWHMYVHAKFGYLIYYRVESHIYFLCIMAATIVLSVVIIYLSRFKIFEWLKYLY